jgi:hypothetical protein
MGTRINKVAQRAYPAFWTRSKRDFMLGTFINNKGPYQRHGPFGLQQGLKVSIKRYCNGIWKARNMLPHASFANCQEKESNVIRIFVKSNDARLQLSALSLTEPNCFLASSAISQRLSLCYHTSTSSEQLLWR